MTIFATMVKMVKSLRNTLFTIAAIGLAAIGLHWNDAAIAKTPLAVTRTILSAQSYIAGEPSFPLAIDVNAPQLTLGEPQSIFVSTSPGATVSLVTQYPDGSIDSAQTFSTQANGRGQAAFSFTLNDFRRLGTFKLTVTASLQGRISQITKTFSLTTWQPN